MTDVAEVFLEVIQELGFDDPPYGFTKEKQIISDALLRCKQIGIETGRTQIRRSPGWLRSEIHERLNQLFPGKDYDHSRYRWLKNHSMTTSHMSQMRRGELLSVYHELGRLLEEKRENEKTN